MNVTEEYDDQYNRIAEVFTTAFPDHPKTLETVRHYKDYLTKNITFPCELTGIEDFSWEEYYVLGPGSQKEYNELKKENPSFTDKFDLVSFEEEYYEEEGIIANIRRKSDQKLFQIPLAELVPTDKKSNNYILLHDYSVWIVNY
jgi:hypothetical protein